MTERETLFNPFPGLRPYEPDEDYLFFGREEEVDDLLRRLGTNRFLAVVGTSGCGKSSLIRSGLIPALHSGTMVKAGSSWRVAILRPGEDPIGHLATALDAPGMIRPAAEERLPASRALLDAALRRGTRALVEAIRQARVPQDDNVLIVVDQFEELFRFRRDDRMEQSRDEAAAFVKLLLEATRQEEVPIYVVITMRADFIGDCVEYQGLPEALNASQYLVPRLTREELRAAITGPVAVGGGRIAPRLVVRILNDLGGDQDQLPVLQHAMMRTWEYWERTRTPGDPIDIPDYEAVGTLRDALSRHAEEAYHDVIVGDDRRTVEHVFKALTDTVTDPRGTRRPCTVRTLADVAGVSDEAVARIVDMFRRPGRSFLMPPVDVPLSGDSIVDLSHESLMRCWTRLISWTEEERASAAVYVRLSRAAGWFDEGAAGLYRDPELELALRWRRQTMPSAAWARRYDDGFDRAMRFLDRSQQAREKERAARRRQWRMWQGAAVLFGLLLIAATWGFLLYRRSSNLAEKNLKDAVAAVNASLAIVDRDPAKLGIDSPQIVKFRADLATKAKDFYAAFAARGYAGESLRRDIAAAHFGLGHANRVLGDRKQAAQEYGLAIKEFGDLVRDYRSNPDYRQDLANAHTFLGETLRQSRETYEQAEKAYGAAKDFQEALRRDYPGEAKYQKDLARTLYNRGILLHSRAELLEDAATGDTASIEMAFERAATDFRQAIQLLDPLAKGDDEVSLQGLARALYDLGNLLYRLPETTQEAERLTLRAVAIHEGLRKRAPENLEYAIELSTFFSNLAVIQDELGNLTGARMNSARAIALLEALARPAPSLSVDLADAHSIRGVLLSQGNVPASLVEFERAQDIFTGLEQDEGALALSAFHLRYADLLVNLAMVERDYPRDVKVRQLFLRGVGAYLAIARRIAASGSWEQAQMVLDGMGRVVKALPDREQDSVILSYKEVETALQARATAKSQ